MKAPRVAAARVLIPDKSPQFCELKINLDHPATMDERRCHRGPVVVAYPPLPKRSATRSPELLPHLVKSKDGSMEAP